MTKEKNITAYATVPVAVIQDGRLSKTELRVLCALLSFMFGKKTWCYPTRTTIAKHCNLPVCKISSATTRLVLLGWLIKEGNGGKSCSSLYTFTIPEMFRDTDVDQVTVTDLVTITEAVTIDVTDSVIRKKETIKIKNIETMIDDSFEKFWNTFPKKASKHAAKRKWIELSPDTLLQAQIIDAVVFSSTQNREWLQDNGKYIPHASTYLSDRRWEDQLPTDHNKFKKINTISHHLKIFMRIINNLIDVIIPPTLA